MKYYESSYGIACIATDRHNNNNNNNIMIVAIYIVTSVYSHRVRRIIASALPVGIVLTFFLCFDRWPVGSNE